MIDCTDEQLHLLKTQIAKDCTDDELALFMYICKKRHLDPFAKQIYAIKRKTREGDKMVIITGIDGFRLSAQRGGVESIDDTVFETDEALRGPLNPAGLVRATVSVWKRGVSSPTTASAYWDEYRQVKDEWQNGRRTGAQTVAEKWATMPRTMLSKCAEALACRRAAPEELSGHYISEELDQMDNPPLEFANDPVRVLETIREIPAAKLVAQTQGEEEWLLKAHEADQLIEACESKEQLDAVVPQLSKLLPRDKAPPQVRKAVGERMMDRTKLVTSRVA